MRDFLAATRERIIVFDGGMGATLEQFDLSLEKDYRLPGRCHEALVLNRPDVIEGVHTSMLDAGAEVLETDTFQASRLKLGGVGPGGSHARDQPQGGADRPQGRRRGPLRGRRDRPDRLPARLRRPDARPDHLPGARDRLRRAGHRPDRGRRGPDHHRDHPGHPGAQGRGVRRAPGGQGARPRGPDPVQRLAPAPGRQDAPGHRHQRGAGHAGGAEGRRHRPQLLHRPRGHARRDPLPRRVQLGARALHPQRRPAAPGPQRRDDLPRGARAAGRRPWASSSSATASRSSAAAAAPRRRTSRRWRSGSRTTTDPTEPAPGAAPGPRQLDDRRHAAGPGPAPDAGRRARQLPGLAQGQGDAAGRRLRRPARRSPRTRSPAAPTCSTSAWR